MVLRPKVLLFDEPLSNIDSKLRRSMRDDIRRLQQESGITSIYVTHDQAEALAVSDEIIIMRDGSIEQQGPPQSLYHRPETAFVANFIGESNVVAGELSGEGKNRRIVFGDAEINLTEGKQPKQQNGPVKLSLRPEVLEIVKKEESSPQTLSGVVLQSAYMGPIIEYSIETKAGVLFTRAPAYAGQFQAKEEVFVRIRSEEIIIIPDDGQRD